MDTKRTAIQEEVDRNFEEFEKILPTIIGAHRDKFALMKDGKILAFYSSAEDARVTASSFIPDGLYSIQHVVDTTINLGFFNNAVLDVSVHR